MHSKGKGDVAVARAVAYYTIKGLQVLLPLGDRQKYDLVVDDGVSFCKVQCKYSSVIKDSGGYEIALRVQGGNKSCYTSRLYRSGDFDRLFVVTAGEKMYDIPASFAFDRNSIVVGGKLYTEYEVK